MIKRIILACIVSLFVTPAFASNPSNIPAVQTIAQMQNLGIASSQYQTVQVLGYNIPGDGGGGLFIWQSSSTIAADSCVNFQATGVSTGRWVRQLNGNLSVLMCGAYNNNTNSAATKTAFQAATNYMQRAASLNPNGIIAVPAGTYDLGSSGTYGVQTNGANWCPLFLGEGPGASIVEFTPSTEGSAFLFNPSIGECNGGGVRGLRVTGNVNTVGCQFFSTNDGVCSIQADSIGKLALLCSCSSGGFVENTEIQVLSGSVVLTNILDYRCNNGGTCSFRKSGIVPGSYYSMGGAVPSGALVLVEAGAFPYSAPFNLSVNNQSNLTGYIFDIQPSAITSFYGSMQIETDGTSITQIVKTGSTQCSCTLQQQTETTAQLIYGGIIWGQQIGIANASTSFKNAYVVLENASSAILHLTAGTGVSTSITQSGTSPGAGVTTYDLLIYGSSYKWNGQVAVTSDTIGDYSTSIVFGHLFTGTNSPTFAVSSNNLVINVADTISANSVTVQGVVERPGDGL